MLAAALIWLFWTYREGFENVTDQGKSFVVEAQLDALTAVTAMKAIGALQTSTYADANAPSSIEDYKGTVVWTGGQPPSTSTTRAQYKLNFPSTINFSKFQGKLPTGITFIGQDFTSPFIILEAKPGFLIDPYYRGNAANRYRGIMSSFGTGTASADYAVTKLTDASGTVYYDKLATSIRKPYIVNFSADVDLKIIGDLLAVKAGTDRSSLGETDISGLQLKGSALTDTRTDFTGVKARTVVFVGPLAALLKAENLEAMKQFGTGSKSDTYAPVSIQDDANVTIWTKADPVKRFKVEFAQPVNLRIAADGIRRKMGGATYVGLAFTDTPPATTAGRGSMAQLGAADYSTINVQTAPESQFPTTFLESGQGAAPQETPASATEMTASATYVDPRKQPVATTSDFSRYVSGVSPTTNRFKVRGLWSKLSTRGMIATLGIAAGKLPDGTYPKVIEILDAGEKKIWPGDSYVDTGISEVFTIGYDSMVDPKGSLETYLRTYVPSLTYVNPAMPRTG